MVVKNSFKLLSIFISILIIFIVAKYAFNKSEVEIDISNMPIAQQSLPTLVSPMNILVVGIDSSGTPGGPLRPKPWRADVLLLVRVDPIEMQLYCLSVPRDTRVKIPNHKEEKIAHAHSYGEIPLTIRVVEDLTGVKVDHFVTVDYASFASLVDIIGGIDIHVQRELVTKHINFAPGLQHMDGKQAYVFISNRNEPMADIARIERQHLLLQALLEKLQKTKIPGLIKIYPELHDSFDTSLSAVDSIKIALFAQRFKLDEIIIHTLPGKAEYISGISYWIPDQDALALIKKELRVTNGIAN